VAAVNLIILATGPTSYLWRYMMGATSHIIGLGVPDQDAGSGPRHGRWAKSSGDQPNILSLDLSSALNFRLYFTLISFTIPP
jgi:hypothetical protein